MGRFLILFLGIFGGLVLAALPYFGSESIEKGPVTNFSLDNAQGFVLEKGSSRFEQRLGREMLIVEADLINTSLQDAAVPAIRVTLQNEAGDTVQSWRPEPQGIIIPPAGRERLKWGFTDIDPTGTKIALYFEGQ